MNFVILVDWTSQWILKDRILHSEIGTKDTSKIEFFLEQIGYSISDSSDGVNIIATRGSALGSLRLDPRGAGHQIGIATDNEGLNITVSSNTVKVLTIYEQKVFRAEVELLRRFLNSGQMHTALVDQTVRDASFVNILVVGGVFVLVFLTGMVAILGFSMFVN